MGAGRYGYFDFLEWKLSKERAFRRRVVFSKGLELPLGEYFKSVFLDKNKCFYSTQKRLESFSFSLKLILCFAFVLHSLKKLLYQLDRLFLIQKKRRSGDGYHFCSINQFSCLLKGSLFIFNSHQLLPKIHINIQNIVLIRFMIVEESVFAPELVYRSE